MPQKALLQVTEEAVDKINTKLNIQMLELTLKDSLQENKMESGHPHVRHEDHLFMKEPVQTIKKQDVGSGVKLRNQFSTILHEGPPVE